MNNRDILKEVLKKFKLDKKIPMEMQKEMLEAKKNTLIVILRRFGKYSIFMMLVIWLFFRVKKYGLVFSIAKSAYIVIVSIIMMVSVISVGSFAAARYIFRPDIPQLKEMSLDIPHNREIVKDPVENNKKKIVKVQYKLAIRSFACYDDTKRLANQITQLIRNNLLRIKGKNAATFVYGATDNSTPQVLVGSIVKFGGTYTITTKVVDSQNSKVLLYISKKVQSEDDIEKVCRSIAQKIAEKI